MIEVVFLYRAGHVNAGAKIMRCDQLGAMAQQRLGARFQFSTMALPRPGRVRRQRKLPEELRGKVVIFLKRADRALDPDVLANLRQTVRAMCIDFVDARMHPAPTVPMDVMIAASHAGLRAINEDLAARMDTPPVAHLVMHHHDPSLQWVDRSADTQARLGYFGLRENAFLPDEVLGDVQIADYSGTHVDPQTLAEVGAVNAHYAVREGPGRNKLLEFKPFTKGFNAAALGAVVLVNRQVPDALDLLGGGYPFLIDAPTLDAVQDGIARLRAAAGGPEWSLALEAMAALREASSAETVTRELGEALDIALSNDDAPLVIEPPLVEATGGGQIAHPTGDDDAFALTDVPVLLAPAEDTLFAPPVPEARSATSTRPADLPVVAPDTLPAALTETAPAPLDLKSAPQDWGVDVGADDRVLFVGDGWLPEGLSEEAVLALDGSEDPDEVADFAPTVVVCHWQDLSLAVLDLIDLGHVHTVAIGPTVEGIFLETVLTEAGLSQAAPHLFRRHDQGLEVLPTNINSRMPRRAYRRWGRDEPRILIATCMKDEGPFILEWIAWHQALGVTDFIVFTNHCTDGTDKLLNRLDALGVVTHLENPAVHEGSTYYQPVALKHLHGLPGFAQADFVISMDVDEFINIHAGTGHLRDLLAEVDPFDALSMSELNHGSNGREEFEPGWVTDQFPAHQTRKPGKWKAARGVKTIIRLSPKLGQIRNHRPDFSPGERVVWLNGSGEATDALLADPKENGIDCRGAYHLVTLEHYPLRSVQSYLVKKSRGDVVIDGKSVGQRYWRLRDRNEVMPDAPMRNADAARAAYSQLLQDQEVATLHMKACNHHTARISEVIALPEFQELWAWIQDQATPEPEDAERVPVGGEG